MYFTEYSSKSQPNWSTGFHSDSIMACIKQGREDIIRYDGYISQVLIYQSLGGGQNYLIGGITSSGRWIRKSYKVYSALEEHSLRSEYLSQWKEKVTILPKSTTENFKLYFNKKYNTDHPTAWQEAYRALKHK